MPVKTGHGVISTKASWSAPFEYSGSGPHPLAAYFRGAAYDEMYSQGMWPSTAVNKITSLQVMLPGKTYRRSPDGRLDAGDSAFGQLMGRPSKSFNPVVFWTWFTSMHHVHGRSFARKIRDGLGRPVELGLIHPSRMRYGPAGGGVEAANGLGVEEGGNRWWYCRPDGNEVQIPRREFIYWPRFNPSSPHLGMSPFEPLRQTLEAEWSARRANQGMWNNGGQHQLIIQYPGKFKSSHLANSLGLQYQEKYAGPDHSGKPLVLEEGMSAIPVPFAGEMLYADTRKLNREEVAAAFDIPPPAIHILDRATFSNVTEQNRMLYRTTMPPHLTGFEAMIEFDLRDGSFGDGGPDFGEAFYFEWLVDGVLRGAFEERVDAYAKGIQTAQITPAEVRELENRPRVDGSDTLLINAAVVPITEASRESAAAAADQPLPDDGTTVDAPVTLSIEPAELPMPGMVSAAFSTVMGRLSRPKSLAEVNGDLLVEGLEVDVAEAVKAALVLARRADSSVREFREVIKQLRF